MGTRNKDWGPARSDGSFGGPTRSEVGWQEFGTARYARKARRLTSDEIRSAFPGVPLTADVRHPEYMGTAPRNRFR